jgi:hypothetical protein
MQKGHPDGGPFSCCPVKLRHVHSSGVTRPCLSHHLDLRVASRGRHSNRHLAFFAGATEVGVTDRHQGFSLSSEMTRR